MGHGIAPLIPRSALTSSPNGIPCPTPQVTRVRTVNVPVARWFPPQACMPAFRQRACNWKDGRIPPLPTAPTKEKVAINISVDRDLLAGRARGEGGNGGRSPHQRAIGAGVPGKSKRFQPWSPAGAFQPLVPGAAARPGTASGMLSPIKGVGPGERFGPGARPMACLFTGSAGSEKSRFRHRHLRQIGIRPSPAVGPGWRCAGRTGPG
jgi:hypothetical protein